LLKTTLKSDSSSKTNSSNVVDYLKIYGQSTTTNNDEPNKIDVSKTEYGTSEVKRKSVLETLEEDECYEESKKINDLVKVNKIDLSIGSTT